METNQKIDWHKVKAASYHNPIRAGALVRLTVALYYDGHEFQAGDVGRVLDVTNAGDRGIEALVLFTPGGQRVSVSLGLLQQDKP